MELWLLSMLQLVIMIFFIIQPGRQESTTWVDTDVCHSSHYVFNCYLTQFEGVAFFFGVIKNKFRWVIRMWQRYRSALTALYAKPLATLPCQPEEGGGVRINLVNDSGRDKALRMMSPARLLSHLQCSPINRLRPPFPRRLPVCSCSRDGVVEALRTHACRSQPEHRWWEWTEVAECETQKGQSESAQLL